MNEPGEPDRRRGIANAIVLRDAATILRKRAGKRTFPLRVACAVLRKSADRIERKP